MGLRFPVLPFLGWATFGLASISRAPSAEVDRWAATRDSIRQLQEQRHAPSLAVAVAQGDRILWEEGFGWADRERRIPATPDTMYSLASITKPITTTALMTLVQAGKIDLDRPINDYLGSAQLRARVGDVRQATVRRVATHTAGLPEHMQFFYENEPWPVPTPDETIARFGNLVTAPGEIFRYSNLGYGLLSEVIARASGVSFAEYLRTRVFLPLGMTHSSADHSSSWAPFEAVRYDIQGHPIPFYRTDHPGASEVYSSAHDLVRFGMFQLRTKRVGDNALHAPSDQADILSDTSLAEIHAPAVTDDSGGRYGLGWDVARQSNYEVLAHTGGMPGVATELQLVPAARLVVVVLCNNEDFDLARTVAQMLLTKMIPQWVPPPHPTTAPISPFVPPPALVGTWQGQVAIYDHDLPFQLKVLPSGDVHLRLGDHFETLLNRTRFTPEGMLIGVTLGDLELKDARRRPYVVGIKLKLRDGHILNGSVTARADMAGVAPTDGYFPAVLGQAPPERIQTEAFILAQWAELKKQ